MNGIKVNELFLENSSNYIKKSTPIKAKQINQLFWVESLEGNHQGKSGDYLICGVMGELYICDKEIFEKTYIEVNNKV